MSRNPRVADFHATAATVTLAETRPLRIIIGFTAAAGPSLSYSLDPFPAFELADAMAKLALKLDPTILHELRRRLEQE